MNGLDVPAGKLAEHMSDISEDVYAAGWMAGTEWTLWAALQAWRNTGRAYWSPGSEYPHEITDCMPELDRLQRQAGGWVWWLDTAPNGGGEVFVPEDRWLRLVAAREGRAVENEVLNVKVPA